MDITETSESTVSNESPKLRFNTITLDTLSFELRRHTEETQGLQEDLRNVAEQLHCTHKTHCTGGHICNKHQNEVDVSGGSNLSSTRQQTESLLCGQNTANATEMREKFLEYTLDTSDQNTQATFDFDNAIMKLEAKLQKVQEEKDTLSHLRMKDSKKHVEQMEKMMCMLEDLQNIKACGDRQLEETERESTALNRKVETLERHIKELYNMLLRYEKPNGQKKVVKDATPEELLSAAKVPQDKHEQHSEVKSHNEANIEEERLDQMCASLGQEVALLTANLSSSKEAGVNLIHKLEQLQKLAEKQMCLYESQLSHIASCHKETVSCLEQQLVEAQFLLMDLQREKEMLIQELHLQKFAVQEQGVLQQEVKAMRTQLEECKEQLHRAKAETTCLQSRLNQEAEGRKKSHQEELLRWQQKAKKHHCMFEDAQSQCSTYHTENKTLKLKLDEKEKMIDFLNFQLTDNTKNMSQLIDGLHQENLGLKKCLQQSNIEIQQLKVEMDQHKSDRAVVEKEKMQLQASVEEQNRLVREDVLQKHRLITELENLRSQLSNLKSESNLKINQEASSMEKEVTARRELVNSLQGRIKHLEAKRQILYQENCRKDKENRCQLQEIGLVKEEKRQLARELEALRSKDQQLRERISQLEGVLHKMSQGFAECQDFIQLKEQDFHRLRLQHARDLKGHKTLKVVTPPSLDTPFLSGLADAPSSQHVQIKSKRQHESPTQGLGSCVKGGISENLGPHTSSTTDGVHRRRSASEQSHRTLTERTSSLPESSRLRRRTCDSDAVSPKMTQQTETGSYSDRYHKTSSPVASGDSVLVQSLLSLGRRSPVHSLLTSDANS